MRALIDPRRAVPAALVAGAAIAAALWFGLREREGGGVATSGVPIERAQLLDTPAAPDSSVGVDIGAVARDFTAMSPDGATLRLSDLRGRPVAVNFWATWCTSCFAELPLLRDLQARMGGRGAFEVVAVNTGEGVDDVLPFLQQLDAPDFRVVMDPTAAVADAYGVYGLPLTVFVDADGVVRARYAGQLDEELAERYIAAAVAGASDPETPFKLRFVTPVETREHVLEVSVADAGTLSLASKRFRCDDSYCAADVVDAIRALDGVTRVDADTEADPPALSIAFDATATDAGSLVERVAQLLREKDDPLYRPDERPLDIRWR